MDDSLNELEQIYRRNYRRLTIGTFVVYAIAVGTAVAALINSPTAVSWISDAMQAEFVGSILPSEPRSADFPQPDKVFQTVKAY